MTDPARRKGSDSATSDTKVTETRVMRSPDRPWRWGPTTRIAPATATAPTVNDVRRLELSVRLRVVAPRTTQSYVGLARDLPAVAHAFAEPVRRVARDPHHNRRDIGA